MEFGPLRDIRAVSEYSVKPLYFYCLKLPCPSALNTSALAWKLCSEKCESERESENFPLMFVVCLFFDLFRFCRRLHLVWMGLTRYDSIGSSGRVVGGGRNMKSFWAPYFYRAGGGDIVPHPPGSTTAQGLNTGPPYPLYVKPRILHFICRDGEAINNTLLKKRVNVICMTVTNITSGETLTYLCPKIQWIFFLQSKIRDRFLVSHFLPQCTRNVFLCTYYFVNLFPIYSEYYPTPPTF